ncbi:MAG TPA: diguanylate cyclase, partial [Planctomycetaceae bacterium]|nr:diguanylate cyclase [Planctomycetaceae bacterium]
MRGLLSTILTRCCGGADFMQRVSSGPYRILIVDDSPSIHEDFRRVFESLPSLSALDTAEQGLFGDESSRRPRITFEVTSAYQGTEALTRVMEALQRKRPFGAAFVDMRMPPGWNGIETIRELWNVDPDLQVVLCTAYSDYQWDELLDRLGVTDRLLLLKKPFDRIEALLMGLALSEKREWITAARAHMARLEERVRERTAALQYQAETDRLTGLTNREVFLQLLQKRIETVRQRSGDSIDAVLFIDLDDFKIVNDTLGHAAGDELLRQVARRLRSNTRHDLRVSRPVCGRLGGDEFAVLLEELSGVEPAQHVAQRLLQVLQQPYDIFGRSVRVRASAGLAVVDDRCPDAAELVRRADVAMYEAKEEGKGRVLLFDEAMSQRLWRRVEVEQRLRVALQEQRFRLAYQPVVDLNNLHLTHYEALLRWPPGEDESPLPGEFLSVARQCGLIESIGNW